MRRAYAPKKDRTCRPLPNAPGRVPLFFTVMAMGQYDSFYLVLLLWALLFPYINRPRQRLILLIPFLLPTIAPSHQPLWGYTLPGILTGTLAFALIACRFPGLLDGILRWLPACPLYG